MKFEKIKFSDFLHYFDFSFIRNNNGSFSLIDLQHANLSNIEDEQFQQDLNGITKCIERLNVYIYDYTIRLLNENTDLQFDTVYSLLKFSEKSSENADIVRCWCNLNILNAICHPVGMDLDFN